MVIPEFTDDEKYLIAYVKSETRPSWDPYSVGVLVAGLLLFCVGAYYSNVPFMACAFIVVCGFKLYEERYQRKCLPIWRSIFAKYEAAIGDSHNSA